jgi:hypothetical protein
MLRPGKVEVGAVVGWRGIPTGSRKTSDVGADMGCVEAGIDVGTGTGVDGVSVTEAGKAGSFRCVGVGDRLGAVAATFSRSSSVTLLL